MKLLAIAAVCAAVPSVHAANIWYPTKTAPGHYCKITALSGATPPKATYNDLSLCDNPTNGQRIWIGGGQISGGLTRASINIHMENASDTNNLARCIQNLNTTTKQFDVYQADCTTPVVPNGTYCCGAVFAKATLGTTKSGPITFLDGSAGAVALGLQNSGSGGWANNARLEWNTISGQGTPGGVDKYHADIYGGAALRAALLWYGEGKPPSSANRTAMINALVNSPPAATTACFAASINCGFAVSSYLDYNHETDSIARWIAYTMGRSELSSPQRAAYTANAWDDLAWDVSGHDYSGATRSIFPPTTPGGSISWSSASTSITGSGTTFTAHSAGDLLYINCCGDYGRWIPIASIADNTHLTLEYAPSGYTGSGGYMVTRKWQSGDLGWMAYSHNYYYAMLCQPSWYGPSWWCGTGYGFTATNIELDGFNNHQRGLIYNEIAAGLATAEDDPRGGWVATDAMFVWYLFLAPTDVNFGGPQASSTGYMQGRMWPIALGIPGMIRFSFVGNPDLLPDDRLWQAATEWQLGLLKPGRNESGAAANGDGFNFAGEGAFGVGGGGMWNACHYVMLFRPDLVEAQNCKYAFQNQALYDATHLTQAGAPYLSMIHLQNRPDITPLARTNTTMLMTKLGTYYNGGDPTVFLDEPRYAMTSRTGFSSSAGALLLDGSAGIGRDHGGFSFPHYDIAMNGKVLMGGDGGSSDNAALSYGGGAGATSRIDTTAGGRVFMSDGNVSSGGKHPISRQHGTSSLAMLSLQDKDDFVTKPTDARRTLYHAKARGKGFILDQIETASATSQLSRIYYHYWLGDGNCGTPNASLCINFTPGSPGGQLVHDQTTAKITSRFFGGTTSTGDGNPAHGDYVSSYKSGLTFRIKFESTGTNVRMFALHKLDGTMPTVVPGTSGSHATFEIQDATQPTVLLAAPGATNNLNGCSVTTDPATDGAQFACDGLAPGTYSATLDGSPAPGCQNIVVSAGSNTFTCDSIDGGAIVVALATGGGGSPTITTGSPLPGATTGDLYSQAITATGGTAPYTCSLVSGSLPAGITLNGSTCVLSGTPTIGATYNFRIRATDAAAATGEKDFALTVSVPIGLSDVLRVRLRLRPLRSADAVTVSFGSAPGSLTGSVTNSSCAAGCVVEVYLPTQATSYYRWQFKLSGVAVGRPSRVRSIVIP